MERSDGVWLVGDIYEGPRWSAYYYIKRDTWETRIYETPEDYQAGVERSAPAFAPYLAYTNIIDWTGLPEADDALVAQQRAIRLTKKLIIADLKTGATTTIAEVPIVLHHKFRPMWLSDTTVEYTLPDGTKKQYTVHD